MGKKKKEKIVFTPRDTFKKSEFERTFDLEETAKLRKKKKREDI